MAATRSDKFVGDAGDFKPCTQEQFEAHRQERTQETAGTPHAGAGTAMDYTEKGRQIARLVIRGMYDPTAEPPELPPVGYVRIVGLDASKLTGPQAKQIADGYKQGIKAASRAT